MQFRTLSLAGMLFYSLSSSCAHAQFTIDWRSIDSGGSFSAVAGPLTLSGTIGQMDAGSRVDPLTGGGFALVSGFWAVTLPRCDGDFNNDAFINSQDLFDFLTAFFALSPQADFNRNGFIDSQDFFDFLAAFFAGCP